MRILVTGASGFVGSVIAKHLMSAGHEVIGLGRGLTKANRMLSRALAIDLGQVGSASLVASKQPRCDVIVHAAAALDRDPHAPDLSLTNCLGTQQMLQLAAEWEVESFVFISSVPVIGHPHDLPVTEDQCPRPLTAYHASKLYGEQLVAGAERAGIAAATLRLSAPVGPGIPPGRIVSVFVSRALAGEALRVAGQGTRCQDYVDLRDVALGVEASIQRRAAGVFNIASGRSTSNLELAERCVQVLDSCSEVQFSGLEDPEEGVRWEVSIAAAQAAVGYRPRYTLEDSIRAIADELQEKAADG